MKLKSDAVILKKKAVAITKEHSIQKLQSSPHQHVAPTDLWWITVTWRSCVCVVVSVSCNPWALWVASPSPVLLTEAVTLGTGL